MKRLLLLRHAKSDWNSGVAGDHDRPLSKRGKKSANAIGKFMAASGLIPDYAITSSAVRARTTLERAMKAGGWECPTEVTSDLYNAGVDDVLKKVSECSSSDNTVLIVGHQPTWSGVVHALAGGSARMVTGALVGIDLSVDSWKRIRRGAGELTVMIPPRLLTDGDLDLG